MVHLVNPFSDETTPQYRPLAGTTAPLPSSTCIRPPSTYMTTTTGSLPVVCCLASACAAVVATVAAAAAAAAVVNDAKSLIVAIEREGSKPSFNALGQCDGAGQAYGQCHACCGSSGGGRGEEYSSLPAHKVDEKTTHQSTSTAGNK
jgi:hypothetical protein